MTTRTAQADAAELTAKMLAMVRANPRSIFAVMRDANLAPETFYRWESGRISKLGPSTSNVISVLNAIGYTLEIVPIEQRIVP